MTYISLRCTNHKGQNVMVCGYFGAVKVGDLYRLEGILNKAVTQKQSFGILLIME